MSPAPNVLPSAPAVDGVRRTLKPAGGGTGYVDGAWWPRTDDLPAELSPLLSDLAASTGPVARVAFHLDDWARAPRRLPLGQVRLEGFRTTDRHTVTLVGPSGLRLVLLVVPASTSAPAAEDAMAAAADTADRRSPADLLHAAAAVSR